MKTIIAALALLTVTNTAMADDAMPRLGETRAEYEARTASDYDKHPILPRPGETRAEYQARIEKKPNETAAQYDARINPTLQESPQKQFTEQECKYGRNTIVGGCNSPPPDYWYEYHYNYRYTYPSRRRECTPLTRGCPL